MIQWIKETFFAADGDDCVQQLINENDRMASRLRAHQLAYAEELNWYRSELRRLQAEIGQIISNRSSSFDAGRDEMKVEL